MNKTFKKVSIILIICFSAAAVLFFIVGIGLEFYDMYAYRARAEKTAEEYEPVLKNYIIENAEAFERLAAYEIEHAKSDGGEIYFYIQPIGELQEERNIVYTVIHRALVRSDIHGQNLSVSFFAVAGNRDVDIYYQPEGVEGSGKISDKLYYTSYEVNHH